MQECAFLGFVYIAVHLTGQIPQNPNFEGMNRRFQAKRAKNSNFHIFEITASIATKFCTVLRPPSTLREWSKYAPNKSKMAHSCHVKKFKKSQ